MSSARTEAGDGFSSLSRGRLSFRGGAGAGRVGVIVKMCAIQSFGEVMLAGCVDWFWASVMGVVNYSC